MSKSSRDIPVEQREFFKHFEKIAYRHQYSEVFDDYLTMLINWFANGKLIELRDQALKKYTAEEKQEMNQMFIAHANLQNEMIINRGKKWYDALGDIYQTITGNWKAAGMGQFFTPETVVDFMAAILNIENDRPYCLVAEPAAGSGRMILAAHAIQTLNYYYAVDLDPMCAKMTAINMCFHNATGLVIHGNGLANITDDIGFYNGYFIDRVQVAETTFLPLLKQVTREQAIETWSGISEYCRIMKGDRKNTVISQERITEVVDQINDEEEKHPQIAVDSSEQEVVQQAVTELKKRSKKYNPDQLTLF